MDTPETDFKNIATQRFHDYFLPRIKSKEIDATKFLLNFSMSVGLKDSLHFFSSLRKGERSITVEHIQMANEKYGVSPDYLFGLTDVVTYKEESRPS